MTGLVTKKYRFMPRVTILNLSNENLGFYIYIYIYKIIIIFSLLQLLLFGSYCVQIHKDTGGVRGKHDRLASQNTRIQKYIKA
jgi:hypothetical protein